jgi:hypothetical protein
MVEGDLKGVGMIKHNVGCYIAARPLLAHCDSMPQRSPLSARQAITPEYWFLVLVGQLVRDYSVFCRSDHRHFRSPTPTGRAPKLGVNRDEAGAQGGQVDGLRCAFRD